MSILYLGNANNLGLITMDSTPNSFGSANNVALPSGSSHSSTRAFANMNKSVGISGQRSEAYGLVLEGVSHSDPNYTLYLIQATCSAIGGDIVPTLKVGQAANNQNTARPQICLLYTSPSPRDS